MRVPNLVFSVKKKGVVGMGSETYLLVILLFFPPIGTSKALMNLLADQCSGISSWHTSLHGFECTSNTADSAHKLFNRSPSGVKSSELRQRNSEMVLCCFVGQHYETLQKILFFLKALGSWKNVLEEDSSWKTHVFVWHRITHPSQEPCQTILECNPSKKISIPSTTEDTHPSTLLA